MGHYRANLRDTEFMLFEVLDRGALLGRDGGHRSFLHDDTSRLLTE